MIEITNTEVVGWEHAIRGMRNPMNSWEKSDSEWDCIDYCSEQERDIYAYNIGPNDWKLMTNLAKGGSDDRKFMRMIVVYADITAPLYWWKEFDTYKVGTVANSCSTMHKIHAKEFDISDFSTEHLISYRDKDYPTCMITAEDDPYSLYEDHYEFVPYNLLEKTVDMLNKARDRYLETKDKKYWWQMIQLLPSSYNQKRTVMLNYEVLHNMYHARRDHRLDEWHDFCHWVEGLSYSDLITGVLE